MLLKKLSLFCIILGLSFTCFAKNAEGHNEDILYIIYDSSDYYSFAKKSSPDVLHSYWIVSDASAFAIDEQGMNKDQKKYKDLQDNVKKTRTGFDYSFPAYSEFLSIGGGSHRAYNHQGFYYDYRDRTMKGEDGIETNKYLDRWELGRDKVLIPAVAAAFGIERNEQQIVKAEAIAIIVYYSHILGDLYEGSERSVNQLGHIANFYFMLMELESDLYDCLKRVGGDAFAYLEELRMNDQFRKIRRSVRSCRSRSSAYHFTRNFMNREMPVIIEKILGSGINTLNIDRR